MGAIRSCVSRAELNWAVQNAGGWEYLIPPLHEKTVLCIDSAGVIGAMVASLGAKTTVLTDDGREQSVRDLMSIYELRNFEVIPFSSWLQHSEEMRPEFDGVICHDLSAGASGFNLHRLQAILKMAGSSLRAEGFIYLGLRNPYSIERLLGRSEVDADIAPSIWRLMSMLKVAGFAQRTRHPFLLAEERLQEVITERGYVPSKNPSKLAERVKGLLFGRSGAKFLAPAYGIVAYASAVCDSLGAKVLHRMWDECFSAHHGCGYGIEVKQYLVLNGGKVILRAGLTGSDDADVIAVLVRDPQSLARREREAGILRLLEGSNSAFSNLFPKLLRIMQIDGTHCFVLTSLPGATLDQNVSELEAVTDAAFQFLVSFHKETVQSTFMDSCVFDSLFAALFESARQRNPLQVQELSTLEGLVRDRAIGELLPNVWMHGDFKVENVMYNRKTLALSGVIDWELSRCPGLPLLDLHYLHIYNRIILGDNWIEAVRAVCLRGQYHELERRRYARYLVDVQLREEWIPFLNVMFLIHHLGCRFQTNVVDEDVQSQVSSLMHECVQLLNATAPTVAGEMLQEGAC